MDADWIGKFFSWQLAAWSALLLNAGAWFKIRNERKRDINTEKAGDWERLRAEIARLDARCDHLQREVDECRRREGEWMARALAAEGREMMAGEARNLAQRIVSEEREKDAEKRRASGNGGGDAG